MSTYLGFSSTSHDSSIAVVNEAGQLIFAESNERGLKNKRAWNVVPDPLGIIEPIIKKYCDTEDIIAGLSWSNKSLFWSPTILRLTYWQNQLQNIFSPSENLLGLNLMNKSLRQAMYQAPSTNRDMLLNLEYRLFEKSQESKIKFKRKLSWDHHMCHAATACYTSPFSEATCVIVDGMGEGTSTSIFSYKDGAIKKIHQGPFLDTSSLGFFYSAICWACGFDPLGGEEWKVMGLAPYGKMNKDFYDLLRPMLDVKKFSFSMNRDYKERMNKLAHLRQTFKEPLDAADLAFTGQSIFEELMFKLLNSVHGQWGGENLILSGGCALNSSCNGLILKNTSYKKLHVPMAPGDDGNSIGSAFLSWKHDHPNDCPINSSTAFLGSEIFPESVQRLIKLGGLKAVTYSESELVDVVSTDLASGKLVGWIQGRAEFGPRSLGNRSILADPRDEKVKEKINSLIKFREQFRPFAPSILDEYGPDYFEDYQYSPYMERTLNFSNLSAAPGVVHTNKTGRLQSVTKKENSIYYDLIKRFYTKTGVPILLNTSFNVMGRPIVHDIEDAIGVFFTSGLDILVIGNTIFKK